MNIIELISALPDDSWKVNAIATCAAQYFNKDDLKRLPRESVARFVSIGAEGFMNYLKTAEIDDVSAGRLVSIAEGREDEWHKYMGL